MKLFEELKRRNVFRVGVAYAVGAWLLLQLTEVLLELLKLPDEIGPIVVTLVAFGFPVVLFFAWAFEMTPQGIKREKDVDRDASITRQTGRKLDRAIIVMLVVVAGYFIWEARFADREAEAPASEMGSDTFSGQAENVPDPVTAAPQSNRQSIAVLPFTNRSANESDAFFVDGIHDDLLTNLARIGGLKVISRTSVMRFKDTEKPIPEIASELGVATVMEGAVQRSGSTVRINVQLIDAQTDEHLWAQIFDRELTAQNLFAIQSEISQQIASALHTTLSPQEQQRLADRPTDNLEAYDAYLRGRQLMAQRNAESVEKAQVEFQRAVDLDPGFALAWAAMAENTRWLNGYSTLSFTESIRLRDEMARRALELDPGLGQAYMALAFNDEVNEDFEASEAKYRKAIELSPGFVQAYDWYSDSLQQFPGRQREALALIRKAEELDPLSPEIQTEIAEQLMGLGRFEAAESLLDRIIQLHPEFVPGPSIMASLASSTGRFDEAAFWSQRALELDPGNPGRYIELANAMLDLGDREAVESIQQTLQDQYPGHWSAGWIETLKSMSDQDFDSALESSRWVEAQFGNAPFFQLITGWLHTLNRDFEKARASFEISSPDYFDRTRWRKGLEKDPGMGCILPLILGKTGDEAMANDLLRMTTNYLEFELPGYIDHADRYTLPACYLLLGETDKALAAQAEAIDHGHYAQSWLWMKIAHFDAVRDDPRFIAMLDQIERTTAQQRENYQRLMAEAGP